MGAYTGPRFPLAPFIDLAVRRSGRPLHPPGLARTCPECHACITVPSIMAAAGWPDPKRIKRVNDRGGLTMYEADNLAAASSMHPSEIWDDWYALTGTPELTDA